MKKNKKFIISFVIIALIVVSAGVFFGKDEKDLYDTAIAERGDLLQEVSVTGRVQASESVDLAFEKTGKVSGVFVNIGDTVTRGSVLARLSSGDIAAQLAQAEANVKIQEAVLSELKRGVRVEEIEVQKVKVLSAEISLSEAKTNIINTLQDTFTKSDDAVRNKTDQFFSNPYGANPQIDFRISNSQLEANVEQGRVNVESVLNLWQESLVETSLLNDPTEYIIQIKDYLSQIKIFLNNVALAVNAVTPTVILTQTTIDGYKTDISTARTNINIAISNTATSEEKYKTAVSALTLARQELTLKEAGTAEEQIIAQEAKVEEVKASVRNYEAQLLKTVIYAPFSGIVTKKEAKVGEIVSIGEIVVSLISGTQFKIETDVPEADISKLEVGNIANITLDAYGDDIEFIAKITQIEPAETIIEGVATYTTTLQFIEDDERVKSGMTANIDILTAKKEDVLLVPSRAIRGSGTNRFVRVVNGQTYDEVPVVIGIRGTDGNTEIIEGILEGDEVIIFIKE